MSTKTKSSRGGENNHEKRSCLAVVESDGLFDGRRRVRLPLPVPGGKSVFSEEEELLGLKQSLVTALELPSTATASGIEIELYESTTQSFQRLNRIDDVPITRCRLRISTIENNDCSAIKTSHPGQELLALPWREFSSSIDLDGKLILKGGKHSITINEVSNSGLGTGTNIWDGAIALAKFLEFHDRDEEDSSSGCKSDKKVESNNNPKNGDTKAQSSPDPTYSVRGKRILELGAGTGLVGIAAHVAFGAREVILTDLEYSLGNLRENLKANNCKLANDVDAVDAIESPTEICTIDAMVLDWFDLETCDGVLQQRPALTTTTAISAKKSNTTIKGREDIPRTPTLWSPDIVLAADVVWVESLVLPLIQTMHRICTHALSSPPLILLSYQRRSQAVEDLLFQTMKEFGFRTEDVTSPVVSTTSGAESKIRIYCIKYDTRILESM